MSLSLHSLQPISIPFCLRLIIKPCSYQSSIRLNSKRTTHVNSPTGVNVVSPCSSEKWMGRLHHKNNVCKIYSCHRGVIGSNFTAHTATEKMLTHCICLCLELLYEWQESQSRFFYKILQAGSKRKYHSNKNTDWLGLRWNTGGGLTLWHNVVCASLVINQATFSLSTDIEMHCHLWKQLHANVFVRLNSDKCSPCKWCLYCCMYEEYKYPPPPRFRIEVSFYIQCNFSLSVSAAEAMEVIPLSEPTTGLEASPSQTLGLAQADSKPLVPKEDGTAQQIMQLLQEIQNPQGSLRSPPFLGENPCIPFFYRPDEQDEVKILVVWGVGVTEAGVFVCVYVCEILDMSWNLGNI